MKSRELVHEEQFNVRADRLFSLLHTPSEIRRWWSADRVIVVPERGGVWAAAWGDEEDRPEYVTVATITVFDPPRRLELGSFDYWARSGPLPFEAKISTEFLITPRDAGGATLQVTQKGFPSSVESDEFFAACKQGWRDTFGGIRNLLANVDTS